MDKSEHIHMIAKHQVPVQRTGVISCSGEGINTGLGHGERQQEHGCTQTGIERGTGGHLHNYSRTGTWIPIMHNTQNPSQ